jgi:hypothetical protein
MTWERGNDVKCSEIETATYVLTYSLFNLKLKTLYLTPYTLNPIPYTLVFIQHSNSFISYSITPLHISQLMRN